jgi:ABC-type Fe3+/spermidine/putrescine transport system ATPase subunit
MDAAGIAEAAAVPAAASPAAAAPAALVPDLALTAVGKRFGAEVALADITLSVQRGEFVAIMGPSGCGKTTLLRIIAGLETEDEGAIHMRGRPIGQLAANQRGTRLVWQNYALFPHLNVRGNIAFGLTLHRHDKREVARKVEAVAELVQLGPLLDRRIAALSGGQKQRVAIARALVTEPTILLLDEPLSALDAHLRTRVQGELKRLQQRLGIAFVYVTHNQSEAFSMADRVVVMNHGRIEQIGTPQDIYTFPRTRFVAEFVGMNNLIEGRVSDTYSGGLLVDCGIGRQLVALAGDAERVWAAGDPVTLVLQAGKIRREPRLAGENRVQAVLSDREFVGSQVIYFLRAGDGSELRMIVQEPFGAAEASLQATLDLFWAPEDLVPLPKSPR